MSNISGNPNSNKSINNQDLYESIQEEVIEEISNAVIPTGGMANGTESLPGLSFTGDPDTGIYWIGANRIGMSCGTAKQVDISTTGTYFSTGIKLPSSGGTSTLLNYYMEYTEIRPVTTSSSLTNFFTGATSMTFHFMRINHMVVIYWSGCTGTGAQATPAYCWDASIPSVLRPAVNVMGTCLVEDNGAEKIGSVVYDYAVERLIFYAGPALTSFAGTGTTTIRPGSITYYI